MTYRDHNYKLNAIAWILNEKGVRIWEKNMPIINQDKFNKECIALELLVNRMIFSNLKNVIIKLKFGCSQPNNWKRQKK